MTALAQRSAPPAAAADPRISLVVVTRNRRRDLLRTLRHLCAVPEQPAVVVVDNASSDGTPAAVRARFPAVEVIELCHNRGGAARNVGAARTSTPYVAFADDDSWWAPGALARAADLLDAHPALGLVNARILLGRQRRTDPICDVMAASPLPPGPGQPGAPLLSFIACAAMVRRGAFLAAGGFLERFGIGGEEQVLGWDLAAAGWQMSYVPELVVHHHPSAERSRDLRRAMALRNTLWTTWLRRPVRRAVRRTARELAVAPRDLVTLRGLWLAVAGAPWVARERRVSPARVEAMHAALDARPGPPA